MTEPAGSWVSLLSGGKDSHWALHRALETGRDVRRLVTVHPRGDSYMYHVPGTHLAGLAAESVGIPLVEVDPGPLGAATVTDSGEQGDAELEPLERALAGLADDLGGVAGLTVGAVASEYQSSRVHAMADRLDCAVYAPLWGVDPVTALRSMLDAGFEIRIVQVAAAGLDESWLGRVLDADALADLEALNDEYGVHVLGEGGEFETLVTDGPHLARPIRFDATPVWEGDRGHLEMTNARLE